MTTPGGQGTLVDRLRDGLMCPQCDYALRGLPGSEVTCPECGWAIDVAQLLTQRWTQPWHRAPGLTRVMLPTAIPLLVFVTCLIFTASRGAHSSRMVWAVVLLGAGLWLIAMRRSQTYFDNRWEGIALALLGHLCLVAYVAAMFVGLFVMAGLFVMVNGGDGLLVLKTFVGGALGVVCVIAGRRGEKYAAKRLIREHLRRVSHPDAENAGQV